MTAGNKLIFGRGTNLNVQTRKLYILQKKYANIEKKWPPYIFACILVAGSIILTGQQFDVDKFRLSQKTKSNYVKKHWQCERK